MKLFQKCAAILMSVAVALGLSVSVSAAESEIIFHGNDGLLEVNPGSVYTETDLFENFKNVLPGDVREEKIKVQNAYDGCDYIKVYMGAVLHDEGGNPISPNVLAELEADDRKGELSNLEYMHDFLEQLTLTVWAGEKVDQNIIYQGTPNSLEKGFEDGKFAFLGNFEKGEGVELTAELSVDIEMGAEYANRIGEVDWVFVFEEFNEVPPVQTGDGSQIWLAAAAMGICAVALIILVVMKRRQRED